jgi:hypothetical protein
MSDRRSVNIGAETEAAKTDNTRDGTKNLLGARLASS